MADFERHLHVDQLAFGDLRQRRRDAGGLVGVLGAQRQAADDTLDGAIRLVDDPFTLPSYRAFISLCLRKFITARSSDPCQNMMFELLKLTPSYA